MGSASGSGDWGKSTVGVDRVWRVANRSGVGVEAEGMLQANTVTIKKVSLLASCIRLS